MATWRVSVLRNRHWQVVPTRNAFPFPPYPGPGQAVTAIPGLANGYVVFLKGESTPIPKPLILTWNAPSPKVCRKEGDSR